MSVEMQQLRHFVALAEIRHFGRAAQALALSQPALSRSIRNLEQRVRAQLLERTRTGVTLTPVGELFVQRARAVLAEVGRALHEVDAVSGRIVGSATFGITPSFDQYMVPDVVASIVARSAQVHLSIRSAFYEELLVMVRTGELDFALALMPEVHGHPEVLEEVVLESRLQVYCRPQHPLAGQPALTLPEIADQAWIVPEQPALRLFERWFESSAASRPHYVIRTTSMQLLRETLLRCDLLSLLPDHLVETDVARGSLLPMPVVSLPRTLRVALISRKRGTVPVVAQRLMESIREWTRHRTAAIAGRGTARRRGPVAAVDVKK